MNHRIGRLVVSALAASVGIMLPASPASGHTDVCGGTGIFVLATGIGPPVATSTHTTFYLSFSGLSACASGMTFTSTGHFHGSCGLSSGEGVTNNGHVFAFAGQGSVLVATGMVNGVWHLVEDPQDHPSCLNGQATNFFVEGMVELHHPLLASCATHTIYDVQGLLLAHTTTCI